MKKNKLLKTLLLLTVMLVGSATNLWGQDDVTLFTTNFSTDDGWITENILTSSTTEATRTIKGTVLSFKGYKSSDLTVEVGSGSSDNGTLTFTGNNISVSGVIVNYYMAIPLVNVNGKITVTTTGDDTKWYYSYKDGVDGTPVDRMQASANGGFTIEGLENSNVTLYIGSKQKKMTSITITTPAPATAPTITTQPEGASYLTGETITPLTVEATASAGNLSYQWYACDDAEKTNAEAITAATNASFTPTEAGFYFCRVTDGNGSTDSDVVEIQISAAAVPTISIAASATTVAKGAVVTLTATVEGNPAPTVQWYSNMSASNEGGTAIDGETNETYSPATTTPGTFYYYAVATNSQGNATSDVLTITVTASDACKLYEAKYSNGFNAFIDESAKTVKVYYLAGTTAPTFASAETSVDATYDTTDATKIVVTAEDGTTTATYTVSIEEVTPYSGTGVQFDGTESWIKSGNTYLDTNNGKTYYAWVINRQLKETEDRDVDARVALGKTRIYFFVNEAVSITLINDRGSSLSTDRKIKVYVNGEEQNSPTLMPKYNASSPASITITTGKPAMIEISSNQNSGDTGWGKIMVTLSNVTIKPAHAASTYVTTQALDFSSVEGLKAYVVTGAANNTVTLEAVEAVPANTPLLLKGTANTEYTIPMAETATAPETNMLVAGDGTTIMGGDKKFDFILWSDGKFYRSEEGTVAVGKAYLHCESDPTVASEGAPALSIDWGEGTTGINSVERGALSVEGCYTLDGRRVAQPTKGLYIVNGRKVIIK